MKKLFVCLVIIFSLGLSIRADELPILNISGSSMSFNTDLFGGATIYLVVNPTTLVAPAENILIQYIIPRTTKDAGYNFNVNVGTATIYAPWHGRIFTK